MQNVSVFNLLDILVKMSNTDSNADTLTAELEDLTAELNQKQAQLDELTSSISDDKYFDASSEIIDRNIENSTAKKIKNIEHDIVEKRSHLAQLEEKSNKLEEEITNLNTKITNFKSYLDVVELRKNSSQNSQTVDMYTQIGLEENEFLTNLENDLALKNQEYDSIIADVSTVEDNLTISENNLESEKQKLEEVRNNLATKNAYINYALKEKDELELNNLNESITELQDRIESIKNNPALIVNDIKDMIANNDTLSIDKKLNQLIIEIEKIPYMNINSDTKLDEFLQEATKKKEDFINYIENKRYEGIDTPLIEERLEYLKNAIILNSEEIEKLKTEVNDIDSNLIMNVKNQITKAEEIRQNIMAEIENYQSLETNQKGHKKAAIQASLNRKNSELKTTNEIINAYLKEQRKYIEKANNIETVEMVDLQNQIHEFETEINDLKKLLILKNKSKDVIEMEKDQEELQKLATEVDLINYRGSFKTTPRKIVADIRKMLNLDYNYHTNDYEDTEEAINEEDYQNMLETPEFSEESYTVDLNDLNKSEKIAKPTVAEKFKVISVQPYEEELPQPIEQKTESLEENTNVESLNEENLLWD